jgi:putative DNA primase/helicase
MGQFLDLEFPPVQYLLRPWLATSSLTMVHALRGHAKTQFVFGVGYAVATGRGFMDWSCEKRGKVLYLDGELSGGLLKQRLEMLGAPTENFWVLSDAMYRAKGLPMPKIDDEAGQKHLNQIIEREGIDLVIVDSLSTLASPEVEKDPAPWMPIQNWALYHRSRGTSMIFVHHDSRGNKPRGHSKKEDILDSMVQLKVADEQPQDEEKLLELYFTKARAFFGAEAAPLVVRLSTRSGHMEWIAESMKENTRARVAELLKQGWAQKDIAKELGISAGRVSQIVREIRMEEAAAK